MDTDPDPYPRSKLRDCCDLTAARSSVTPLNDRLMDSTFVTHDSSAFHSWSCFKTPLHREQIKGRQSLNWISVTFPVWRHRQNLGLNSALPLRDSNTAWDSNYPLSGWETGERIKWAGELNTWIRSNFNEEFEYFPSCVAKLICSNQPSSALIWSWKTYCGTIL